MKKLLYIGMALALLNLSACNNDDEAEIGEPGSKLEGINATWVLVEVEIQDENSINKDRLSVFDYYADGGAPEITFNSSDLTYSNDGKGKRNFFGSGGSWAFDDADFPTMITLNDNDEGTIEVMLTSTIRPQDKRLQINYARLCDDKAYATYYFQYERK